MSKQIRGQPRKVVFPLSSRRLKLYQLQQLAQALELPTSASSDDLRVMVEEKLRAMDRNPLNTQVVMDLQGQRICHYKMRKVSFYIPSSFS